MTHKKKINTPKITSLIEILLIATILFFAFNITNVQATNLNNNDDFLSLDYTLHDPIEIINNGNFSDYGFPGNGLISTPYIIENYNITDTVFGGSGILVKDTTVYFEIRNCFIYTQLIGIKIENVLDGTAKIINNTCRAYKGGSIVVIGADNTQIINNTCNLSFGGISIDSSTSVDIYGNNCTGTGTGIKLQDSPSSYVINNTCIGYGTGDFDDGILMRYSPFSLFENNTCDNYGRSGIYVYESNSLKFINNTFTNNKHGIYGSTGGGEYTSNKFFYNENGAVISGTNTVQDNLCIGNYVGINGIGSASSTISNNTCYNNTIGIRVSGGHYGSIQDNICNDNFEYGIFIENSLPPFIGRNTCNDNGKDGIWINNISGATGGGTITENICSNNGYLGISVHHSEESDITDNVCTNDGIGIFDGSVEDYLSYNVVSNIVNGETFGYIKSLNNSMLFASSYKQIIVVNCHNLTIANHTMEDVGIGINIVFCYNVTSANNTFINSDNYGLYLTASLNTTIIHNVFNDIYCGAFITSSYNTTAHMNWNTNSFYGFKIYRSENLTLTNNMLWYSGIFMEEESKEAYLTYVVENNYVNGNPLGYIKSLSSSTISGSFYGQLILVDCSDTTVSSLNIDDTFIGLYLLYCDDLTIIDNDFSNNYYGIYLSYTSNCDIRENEINYNTINGIYSLRSGDNLFTYNNLRENYEYGMYFNYYGEGNFIHHNNFYDNNLAQIVSSYLSQAFDGAVAQSYNTFYDIATQEGNYWSEGYDVSIGYIIDNFDGARYDAYPLDDPAVPPIISEFIGKNFSITLVISIFLIIPIIRKKRKNLKLKT